MTPIISPWIIYFLGGLPKITTIVEMFSVFSILAFVILLIVHLAFKDDEEVPEAFKSKTLIMTITIFAFVVNFLNITIPNRDTAIKMLIANEITYERLDVVKLETKEIYNVIKKDVFEMIQEINKEEE
jgi:uncharacterized membrane protein